MFRQSKGRVALHALLLSVASGVNAYAHSRVNPGYDPRYLLRRDDPLPDDFSVVGSFTAIGDSFAAGLGAGTALDGTGDADCSRYDAAYPIFINAYFNEAAPGSTRDFQFLACSQATTSDVNNQIDGMQDGSQDLVTVSAGGNDVGFGTVLKKCIYLPYSDDECNSALDDAEKVINDNLLNNVDDMLGKLDGKMKQGAIVVYTLYARFFNAATESCNDKSWSFFDPIVGDGPKLTQEKRKRMNDLVDAANSKLKTAIVSAGGSSRPRTAKYVAADYDNIIGLLGGRFCEDTGSQDPQYTPEERELFQRHNVDPYADIDHKRARRATAINALDEHSMEVRYIEDGQVLQKRLPDALARVFHPNDGGHSLIAETAIAAWVKQRASDISWDGKLPDTCHIGGGGGGGGGGAGSKSCTGGPSEAPWNSKPYVTRDAAALAATDFCAGTLNGDTEKNYNEDGNDKMKITLKYSSGTSLSKDDCTKALGEIIDGCDVPDTSKWPQINPFNWKYGGKYPLSDQNYIMFEAFNNDHIDRTCNNNDYSKYVTDKSAYDTVKETCKYAPRGPSTGTIINPAFVDTSDDLALRLDIPNGGVLSEDDCNKHFNFLLDTCNGGPNNPMNWKHGGKMDRNAIHFEVVPRHERRMPEPYNTEGRCESWYKFWYAEFKVWGSSYANNDFGQASGGLMEQLRGCGAITAWHFEYFDKPDGSGYEWYSSGTLPIGTRGCVGRAMHSAGGPEKGCDGNG